MSDLEEAEDAAGLAAERADQSTHSGEDSDADVAPTQEDATNSTAEESSMPAALPLLARSFTQPLVKTPVSSRSYLRLDAPITPHVTGAAAAAGHNCSPLTRSPSQVATPLAFRTLGRTSSRWTAAAPDTTLSAAAASVAAVSSPVLSQRAPLRTQSTFTPRPPLTHQHALEQCEATPGSCSAQMSRPASPPHSATASLKRARPDEPAELDSTPIKSDAAAASCSENHDATPQLQAQILVGPVMGEVDTSTARVLLEINVGARITATLTPQTRWYRPRFEEAASVVQPAESGDSEVLSPTKKQKTDEALPSPSDSPALNSPLAGGIVHRKTLQLHAFHPTIFAFEHLQPDTIYLVQFAAASDSEPVFDLAHLADRTGLFRTHFTDPSKPIRFIAFSCDCASEVGRDKENLWIRLYNDYCASPSPSTLATEECTNARFDVMLHIGDQVYADAAFAKGEQLFATSAAEGSADDYSHLSEREKLDLIYDAYAEMYRHTWNDSPTRLVLACGSHLMQWDDHELRNDWGSFEPTATDKLIATQARKAFHLYQKQLWDPSVAVGSSQEYDALQLSSLECSLHIYGRVGVLFMDNRSCRTADPTCSVFSADRYEEERRRLLQQANGGQAIQMVDASKCSSNGNSALVASDVPLPPHAHAYFGASQWHQLYQWFPTASASSVASASSSSAAPSSFPTDHLSVLLVVNPSPAFFIGTSESERLIPQTCLLDKLGLGLHPQEQGQYLNLFERWKYSKTSSSSAAASVASTQPQREVLFIGGDSHFGMTSSIWTVDESVMSTGGASSSASSSSSSLLVPDPRVVGGGSPRGPAYGPVPTHPAVRVLFQQILCSALSSRRPRYSSFVLWKKSLWKEHKLDSTKGKQGEAAVGPYFLTHESMIYAHNFAVITASPAASPPSIQKEFVLSGAHRAELAELKGKKA